MKFLEIQDLKLGDKVYFDYNPSEIFIIKEFKKLRGMGICHAPIIKEIIFTDNTFVTDKMFKHLVLYVPPTPKYWTKEEVIAAFISPNKIVYFGSFVITEVFGNGFHCQSTKGFKYSYHWTGSLELIQIYEKIEKK